MKTQKKLLPFALSFFFALAFFLSDLDKNLQAQITTEYALKIDNYDTRPRYLRAGDWLIFKQKNNDHQYKARILSIGADYVVLEGLEVRLPLQDLEKIYLRRKAPLLLEGGFYTLGVGFFTSFLRGVFRNNKAEMQEFAIISGSFITLAQLMRPFRYKKYNFEKKARIQSLAF
ncbi:hypothetical protein [Hugenholtzia roseola]|uniref:hypothetical protein n=1 Tax=Hugenholtzia roseola TaxID=1002 RepID=UPI00040AD2B3|nr:hypothetical protein [Hugenholtzia roseola]